MNTDWKLSVMKSLRLCDSVMKHLELNHKTGGKQSWRDLETTEILQYNLTIADEYELQDRQLYNKSS